MTDRVGCIQDELQDELHDEEGSAIVCESQAVQSRTARVKCRSDPVERSLGTLALTVRPYPLVNANSVGPQYTAAVIQSKSLDRLLQVLRGPDVLSVAYYSACIPDVSPCVRQGFVLGTVVSGVAGESQTGGLVPRA